MSATRRLLFASMAALAAALAAARSPGAGGGGGGDSNEVLSMGLADVLGRTVCPLKVVLDEDPLRLPARIKKLTCDRDRDALRHCHCREYGARCVEVLDNAVVQYLPHAAADARALERRVVQVAVGCSCVLRRATPAALAD